jgi:capsular polysaccharide biosynthesis protein
VNPALAEYAGVLRTRWRWLLWGLLLGVGATTLFLILQPPMYRTDQTVFVRTPGDVSQVLDGGDTYAQGRAGTYAAVASSPSLSGRVISDLGLDRDPDEFAKRITAKNRHGTVLIDIAVRAPSPTEATQTATVLFSELAATVQSLESVPGALVPRAELVQVDPPGQPRRELAWGASTPLMLLMAGFVGLTLGAAGAVIRSFFPGHVRPQPVELSESHEQRKTPYESW